MIILFGGQKGGTGKSTLAVNIAAWLVNQEQDTIIVDADAAQATSSSWTQIRESIEEYRDIPSVIKSGNTNKLLIELDDKYKFVIVDAGGHDSRELRSSLLTANLLITPIKPAQPDLETMPYMVNLIEESKIYNEKLKSYVILSQAPTHPGTTLTQEARTALKELDPFILCNTVIGNRKSYIDSMTHGVGVIELPKSQAATEINSLANELFS